ncbi:GGDEF domain-containing protein [Salipiger sp. IMCC34102]|uniref:GGDEF domain-containing protein n=1 Tax=Salipiger sp. IMCC34102 TaxID=2510647 RepID=UPI00101C3C6C|nr:GGDEF domain-containing protein [Salipiger sp. IMCC34102]RYH03927.1 GGDEF domain-containing protein [Salipiger sp. IMCC34102]
MVQRNYDAVFGPARLRDLTRSIIVGLILYNGFFFTSFLLTPDLAYVSFILRIIVVTLPSQGLILLLRRVSPGTREWLILAGMVNAHFAMVLTVWISDSPLAGYAFAELNLILVFGAFTLGLRLLQSILFLTSCTAVTLLLIGRIDTFPDSLRAALWLQSVTAYVFCLYGSLQIERRRCTNFMEAFRASERASTAEETSQELQELSRTDPLTGLANRRALELEVATWFDDPAPIALAMIDIDHFKLYNDSLGHPEGDDCLRRVSAALRDALGDFDTSLPARIGGEEFAIALKGSATQDADALAERVRHAIETLALPHPGRLDGLKIVTISVGVARPSPGTKTSLSDVLRRADAALYAAKRRGRNTVCIESRGIRAA